MKMMISSLQTVGGVLMAQSMKIPRVNRIDFIFEMRVW